jgi:hypothetical protein
MTLSIDTQQLIYGLVIVFLVTVVGMVLTLQGWRSRAPAFDMLTYFNSAETLLKTGTAARYGDISSYGSFSPPGTTWLMAPGMLLFNDARLYGKFGSAVLHLGTLLGVFLLGRASLDIWCAYLSVVLYGLSELGLFFAGFLWPIGHPVFYVWMAYFALHWVTRRNAQYLAIALVIWTIGMYVDMAITPAALVLPALWLIYRPPLFSRFHLLAAALTLAVWYPYLEFEMARGFVDLKSQLLRHNVLPTNYKDAWCDPDLTLMYSNSDSTRLLSDANPLPVTRNSSLDLTDRLLRRGRVLIENLFTSFPALIPFAGFNSFLSLLVLSAVIILSGIGALHAARINPLTPVPGTRDNEVHQRQTGAVALSLAVPWLILVFVAEPSRPERFYWLWPLQAMFLVALITNSATRLQIPALARCTGQILCISVMLIPSVQSHLNPWLENGWSGSDPDEIKVVDYVGQQLGSEGREQVAIGYQIFIYEFMANYAILDRQYKVGAEFDFLFKHRHGISNTNQCAEGISPNDEYRIVQTRPKQPEWHPRNYFDAAMDSNFRLVRKFDSYQVFKRD